MSSMVADMMVLTQKPSPLVPLYGPSSICEKGMHPAGQLEQASTFLRKRGAPVAAFMRRFLFSISQ